MRDMKRIDMSQNLTPQEQSFVDALLTQRVDGTWLTLTDAAIEAGYNVDYARRLRHRPKISAAINARCAELEAENAETTQALVKKLGRDGLNGDKRAAALYLRAVGRGNTTNVVTTIAITTEEHDRDFIERAAEVRRNRLVGIIPAKN